MFKRFNIKEDVAGSSLVKSSVQRAIRAAILAQYPTLTPALTDLLLPKKAAYVVLKVPEYVNVLAVNGELLWFQDRDGPWFPTLRLLHQFPDMMRKVQVDRGAIKFVLSGANIMSPGLTSPGGRLNDSPDLGGPIPTGTPVAIHAEGKELAVAVGILKMSSAEIREKNKGIGIDSLHFLNDGLWTTPVNI